MASGTGPQNGAGPGEFGEGFDGPNKSDVARMKREARDNPDNQNPSRSSTADSPSSSSSRSTPTQGSRTITGLMFFAVLFSLVGNELKIANQPATGPQKDGVSEGGKIIIGGIFATALLTLLSHAGDNGRQFAVGLALVTTASSVLVFGAPVWDAANKLFGSTPTTPVGATTATKPTQGTATAAALAQAA
jgi:hypothetical protein